MIIKLKNKEELKVETDKHSIIIDSNYDGEINLKYSDKDIKISDMLVEEQIDKLIEENKSWGIERLQPTKEFLFKLVNRASKALKVDKNKLCFLMIEKCNYSAINYFQKCNYYNFEDLDDLHLQRNKLYEEISSLKKKHSEEIIKLQNQITKLKNIKVEKIEDWLGKLHGSIHIHGHVHNHKKSTVIQEIKNRINVSCEMINYTPISADEIIRRNRK